MKLRLLHLSGIAFGCLFALLSALRYFVIYPDLDKALVYTMIGIVIAVVSWGFSIINEHEFKIERLEEYQEDRVNGE